MLSAECAPADTLPQKQENEDECRACGDAGLLLLCEGCPNSFHGDCLEPPVSIDDVEGDWFCPECEARRRPQTAQSEDIYRLMRPLVDQINDTYPRVYSLPSDIRGYFENVKTGEEGEYVEVVAPPTNKKGAPRTDNSGAMKPPNYKDLRDKHGNLRLCYRCGLTTGGDREMMPCDYCTNEWHLDCLDPPASVIPKRFGPDGKPPPPWRCPLHIERDLTEHGRAQGVEVGHLGRQPRIRRPKNAISVLQSFARPVPSNNGIIDVQLEPELPDLNVKTVEMGGNVIRIPEKKVILDFIKKARWEYYYDIHLPIEKGFEPHQFHSQYWLPDNPRFRDDTEQPERVEPTIAITGENGIRTPRRTRLGKDLPVSSVASSVTGTGEERTRQRLYVKPFIEQQTIQNLVELSGASVRPHSSGSAGVSSLIDQLIADAPEDVTRNIQLSELEQLDLLQKLLDERRNTVRAAVNGHAVTSNVSTDKGQHIKAKLNGSLRHDAEE